MGDQGTERTEARSAVDEPHPVEAPVLVEPRTPDVRPPEPGPTSTSTSAEARPSAEAPPVSVPDDPLPPDLGTDAVRIRIDADLSVHLARHGTTVDVRLTGHPDAIQPLLAIGPELGASLAGSGFSLGQFGAEDHRPPPPPPAPVEPVRARPRTWRSGRYA